MKDKEYEKNLQNVVSALSGDKISFWTDFRVLLDGFINFLDEKLKLEDEVKELKKLKEDNKKNGLVKRLFGAIRINKELRMLNKRLLNVSSEFEKYDKTIKLTGCFYKAEGLENNLGHVTSKSDWNKIRIEDLEKKKSDGLITADEEKQLERLYVFQSQYDELYSILDTTYQERKSDEEYDKKEEERKKRENDIQKGYSESVSTPSPIEAFDRDITTEYNQDELYDSESKGKKR